MSLVRAGRPIATFAEDLVRELRSLIVHDAACVLTFDPASGLLTGSYKFGGLAGAHEQDTEWAQIEYGSDDPSRMAVIATRRAPAMATSQLPQGTDGSVRIRKLVGPGGYRDELRMVAREGDHVWGGVNLFRAHDQPPFARQEVALLASLSEAVANGLRAGLIVRSAINAQAGLVHGPATLIVDLDDRVQQISMGTSELLDALTDQAHRSPAASIVRSLVEAARRYADGDSSALPRARLRSPSGQWLLAQAAPLWTDDAPSGAVAITISEARPPEILGLLSSTFGLTARERDVTQLVLAGNDTKTIAKRLAVSAYTVQDHLKAIFAKADVRSRRELMARVFFDQYAPRLTSGVGPSGWFEPSARASRRQTAEPRQRPTPAGPSPEKSAEAAVTSNGHLRGSHRSAASDRRRPGPPRRASDPEHGR